MSVGIALGPRGLVAAAPGTRGAGPLLWHAPLSGEPRGGAWPELEAALAELRTASGARPAVLDVALLPPWCGARVLEFPRLRPHELAAVLRRDARRYFLEARGAQVAAAEVLGPAGEGRVKVLAAVMPEAVAEAVHACAAAAGWRVGALAPAHSAWAAAALAAGAGDTRLLLASSEGLESVTVRRGRVDEVRRSLPAEGFADDVTTAVAGEEGPRLAVANRLGSVGVEVCELPFPAEWAESPAALAAGYAGRATLRFVTPAMAESALRRARKAALVLASAATVLLGVAGGIEAWGAGRELEAVRARRREIGPAVREVSKARGTLKELDVRFATLRALEGSAPQWPVVVTMVAQHLPPDARLTAFRAEGDSLLVEGEARRAGRVFDAMSAVPGVVAVRAAAPVRREFREGAPPVERFVLTARLGAHRAAPRKESFR
ncbi:MAG TPA: hypothetical protein VF613_18035 [Longimicrobium sp.]|jgi:hypothetical protein